MDTTRGVVRVSLDAMVEAQGAEKAEMCSELFARTLIGAVRQPQPQRASVGRTLLTGEMRR